MKMLADFAVLLFIVIIPSAMCIIHFRCPEWFSRWWKRLLWVIGTAIFSWCYVNASIWIPYTLKWWVPRGPEAGFALFFGWMYLWIVSVPVVAIYVAFRIIRWAVARRKEESPKINLSKCQENVQDGKGK